MNAPTPPRNAAQLTQIQAHYEEQVEQVIAGLTLRRWLVERMLDKAVPAGEFLDLAEKLYAFIVGPGKELTPPAQE